jgi:hypothetical protein
MKQAQILVEFIGGPFDGHSQALSASSEELASTVALPVNDNVFRMLHGKLRGPARPSRTVALYELRRDEEAWKYYFLGSRMAAELNLENWQV